MCWTWRKSVGKKAVASDEWLVARNACKEFQVAAHGTTPRGSAVQDGSSSKPNAANGGGGFRDYIASIFWVNVKMTAGSWLIFLQTGVGNRLQT